MGSALSVLPSAPEMPTALCPYSLSAQTRSWLTLPTSTSRTASIVASSVTRRPPLNCTGRPSAFTCALMALPPPWTSTMRMPRSLSISMSATTWRQSSGFSMADPPYLMTKVLPAMRWIHGRASFRTSTFEEARSRSCLSRCFMVAP